MEKQRLLYQWDQSNNNAGGNGTDFSLLHVCADWCDTLV